MQGRRKVVERTSLRVLFAYWACLFGVLALVVAGSLVWSSTRIHQALVLVTRNTESMAIADNIELQILTFDRAGNLLAAGAVEEQIRRLLARARERLGGAEEAALLDESARRIDAYFDEFRALAAGGLEQPEAAGRIRPLLDRAVASLEALRALNESQVEEALAEAARMDRLSNRVGAGAAVVLLVGLAALMMGVNRFVQRPLLAIHRTIGRLHGGDAGAKAPEAGPLELNEIGRALNEMIEALARQRQNQLVFLSGVAHDLRNPLSALRVGVQGLVRRAAAEPEGPPGRTVALLERQIDRLTRMVDDLLDAARIEAGQLQLHIEELDLRRPAREIVDLYAPTSPTHQVTVEAPERPVLIRGDVLRLEQVISNLVSNALKYSPGGGPVRVRVEAAEGEALLSVQDRGIGIPPGDLPEIFVPFRRHTAAREVAPGAGLGLSVVRRIVAAHGGRIEVDSAPHAGSTFLVRLPLSAPGGAPGLG